MNKTSPYTEKDLANDVAGAVRLFCLVADREAIELWGDRLATALTDYVQARRAHQKVAFKHWEVVERLVSQARERARVRRAA